MHKESGRKVFAVVGGVVSFAIIAGIVFGFASLIADVTHGPGPEAVAPLVKVMRSVVAPGVKPDAVKKFATDEEFTKYLEAARSRGQMFGGMGGGLAVPMSALAEDANGASVKMMAPTMAAGTVGSSMAPRASETNVQVAGIDEPDIVKTDGQSIFFSRGQAPYFYGGVPMPVLMDKRIEAVGGVTNAAVSSSAILAPVQPGEETDLLAAFPPEALAKLGAIGHQGDLLLFGNTLVIFSGQSIYGYDVTDRANPEASWSAKLADGTELVQARSASGKLYLVEKFSADVSGPKSCLFEPMTLGGAPLSVRCTDIYHPVATSDADAVFTVARIDPRTGAVGEDVSFVGSASQSTVYMNQDAIYVTYESQGDPVKYIVDFFQENKGLVPDATVTRLEKLESYDLGNNAKMTEFQDIVSKMELGMSGDARLKFENDRANRMKTYAAKHIRDLLSTGIVRVNAGTLAVEAVGNVPGRVLNQFSLDEYQGNLRIATTVGENDWYFGFGNGQSSTANDVYVLDGNLREVGALLDLGAGERIYSARFDGARGYLVTFRQTDPFFVLDLSDPKVPRKAGELNLPGFSSYLHPLGGNLVLGLGRQDASVKLSLFDVTTPDNPVDVSDYLLDEYWTPAADNHHAFLADPAHKAFFLPGGKGGYIFSYDGGTLSLAHAASDDAIQRAVYLGDYLYVIGRDSVYVYSEKDWSKVKTLAL